ncbi:ExbD/TolR family protein [Antarctobacter jejuensis]|uniref:ExbD/TolR family protein n=1 Tax=Antarctobacter jejuensis TaxID=1439938 RepID=UPI003FD647AE
MRKPTRFWPGPLKPRAEPIVPMINVVFLMLMFFMLAAHFSDPAAGTTRALATGDAPQTPPRVLILARSGTLTFGALTGPEAISAAIAAGPVRLQAEGGTEAQHLARALNALALAGGARVDVVMAGAAK